MGVQLGDLFSTRKVTIDDMAGKRIAFDGHNILYQFLAIIRGRRGEPLRDHMKRVTSHLSGLIYRNSNLIECGIKVAYVFDGTPHKLKSNVIEIRKEARKEAKVKYERALRQGKVDEARRYGQQSVVATSNIVDDAKRLLTLMGVPWIQAPSEGEAQIAYLATKGAVWAAASQDYDSLLFGAPRLIRNLSITGRRKLPKKKLYVKIEPELIDSQSILRKMDISREQLVDLSILIGTDYNSKIAKGIGPKTALRLIKKHRKLENVLDNVENPHLPSSLDEIRDLFLSPEVTDEYKLEWQPPDQEGIIEFLCEEHNFNKERVLNAIKKLSQGYKMSLERTTLSRWFQ